MYQLLLRTVVLSLTCQTLEKQFIKVANKLAYMNFRNVFMVLPGFYFEILHLFNLPLSSGVTEVILAFFGNVY